MPLRDSPFWRCAAQTTIIEREMDDEIYIKL
jgi:hypothetical protein